jgi:hypothetical protein
LRLTSAPIPLGIDMQDLQPAALIVFAPCHASPLAQVPTT